MPALKAGKDVFVEWPLGNNLIEAEEMAALAKEKGLKTVVGLQARFRPALVKTKEIVDAAALGKVLTSSVRGTDSSLLSLSDRLRYSDDPDVGASLFSIPVAHALDAILYILGEFFSLNANTNIINPTVSFSSDDGNISSEPRIHPDDVSIQGTLTTGTALSFHYSLAPPSTPSHFSWLISGGKGALKVEGNSMHIQIMGTKLYEAVMPKKGAEKDSYDQKDEASESQWREVVIEKGKPENIFGGVAEIYEELVMGDGKKRVDFEEAVKRHRMVEAVLRSAKDGTRESYM